MADKKISALNSASTPLAGTEVLPIVQSGSTVKVSVGNLTEGRDVTVNKLFTTAEVIVGGFNTGYGKLGVYDASNSLFAVANSTSYAQLQQNGGDLYVNTNAGGAGSGNLIFRFGGGFTSRASINGTSGDITASTGNFVVGTAGKGIDFSANTHAPGMTSELLNDYEEGEFTPFFTCDGSNPTVTYSAQSGRYTKIGRQVFVQIRLIIDTVSGGSGNLRISGLPYAAAANSYANALSRAFVFNFTANLEVFNIPPGSDTVLVYVSDFTNTQATSANLQNGAFCMISGSYTV